MANGLKETDRVSADFDLLRTQYEELKQENEHLRAELQQSGIEQSDHQQH